MSLSLILTPNKYKVYAGSEEVDGNVLITGSLTVEGGITPPAGGLTLGAIDTTTPNADGMVLAAGVLQLEAANASFGGALTAGAQSIGGAKTFASGSVALLDTGDAHTVTLQSPATQASSVVYTLPAAPVSDGQALTCTTGGTMSWSSTAGIAMGAFGSSPNANGATLTADTLVLEPCNQNFPGGISTGAQEIAGQKTFIAPVSLLDTGDSHTVSLQAPSTQSASVTYTLPPAPSSSGQVLSSTTGGVMSWSATGGLSLGAIGAIPNPDGASLSGGVLNLQPANSAYGGVFASPGTGLQQIGTDQVDFVNPIIVPVGGYGAPAITFNGGATSGLLFDEASNSPAICAQGFPAFVSRHTTTGLASGVAKTILQVRNLGTSRRAAFRCDVSVYVNNGTDAQISFAILEVCAACLSGGTPVSNLMSYAVASSETGGSLTVVFGVNNVLDGIDVQVTATSGLSSPTIACDFNLTSVGQAANSYNFI